MKMEGVSELVNGRTEVAKSREIPKQSQPSPKEIGREFVRQYYTMLSEHPEDVYRFYSHESYFVHDAEQPVQGQQKIQKAIERLSFIDCKARIYTVTGTAIMNSGLVIQVCGELTVRDIPGRRFVQTFVLCPQSPKKYYVQNDIFQWVDRAFGDPVPEAHLQDSSLIGIKSKDETINGGDIVAENEQQQNIVSSGDEEQQVVLDVVNGENEKDEPVIEQEEKQSEIIEEKISPPVEQEQVTVQPRSWAKLAASSPPQSVPFNRAPSAQPLNRVSTQSSQPITTTVSAPNMAITNCNHSKEIDSFNGTGSLYSGSRYLNEGNCKLFIGNIMRTRNPDKMEDASSEIKAAFEKFGPVVSVHVPRRLSEMIDRCAYAFIVMKSVEGAKNAFNSARKDRDLYYLRLKLDSFGFEGEVTLSEQKGNQGARLMYSHKGGPSMQGLNRGGFNVRGGRGGPGGGSRGLHSRQYGGGNEYRHASNTHVQPHD